ncbi:MAG TPA: hypothetical protein PLR86_10390, partial [Planctomycetota bacterium]|nr:hypothetical protein [Planctomycetota bacterium]
MGFLVESKITLLITGVLSILGVNGIYFFTSDDSSSENLILNSPTQSTIEATMQENTNINQHPQTSENNNPFQGFYKSNQVATQTLAQNCKICQGTGFKTCSKCKDSGKPGYIGICSDCNGTGKCKKCEGTGTVIKKRDFWSTHNNWNTSNSNQHINIKKIP